MSTGTTKAILLIKVKQLVTLIMERKSMGLTDALHYLYSSKLYELLTDDETKMWYLSTLDLYERLKKEKRSVKKNDLDNDIMLFVIFCIENYKDEMNISVEETMFLFSEYDVFSYLRVGYDALHTQGKEYIMEDIEDLLKVRRNRKK